MPEVTQPLHMKAVLFSFFLFLSFSFFFFQEGSPCVTQDGVICHISSSPDYLF